MGWIGITGVRETGKEAIAETWAHGHGHGDGEDRDSGGQIDTTGW